MRLDATLRKGKDGAAKRGTSDRQSHSSRELGLASLLYNIRLPGRTIALGYSDAERSLGCSADVPVSSPTSASFGSFCSGRSKPSTYLA